MKKLFTVLFFIFIAFVSTAQSKQQTIVLNNGTTITGVVHQTADGVYVVRNEMGEEFYFSAQEIKSISVQGAGGQETAVRKSYDVRPGMRYQEIKGLYNAADYQPQDGDRLSTALPLGAILCPFIGIGKTQYYGGIATGILRVASLAGGVFCIYEGDESIGSVCFISYLVLGVIDAAIVSRRVRVLNQYYQNLDEIRYGKGVSLSVDPFVSMTPNTVFASSKPTAGLSLKLNF